MPKRPPRVVRELAVPHDLRGDGPTCALAITQPHRGELWHADVLHLLGTLADGSVDLVVADLSFISLRLVLPAFAACVADGGDVVPMVKPQFEVGKERVGSGGVVRDPALRAEAVADVARSASANGMRTLGVVASPLPGPSGNVEYFLWLRRTADAAGGSSLDDATRAAITSAIEKGPQ